MQTYSSIWPLAAVLVSLAGVIGIVASRNHPNLREGWTFVAALAKFGIVLSLLPAVLAGRYPETTLFEIAPNISLALKADLAGMIFALLASFLWILTSAYSVGYERGLNGHKQTRYFASFAVCLSATVGIAFSAHLLTFLIFYEILSFATYPLVIHRETPEAISGGRKYLAYMLTGGALLLAATVLTYSLSGTLDFSAGGYLTPEMGKGALMGLFFLFLFGFGFKSALMPLHSWLPAAMAAPTPVSALLHAVAVVKAGVFGFIRAFGYTMSPHLLAVIGANNIAAAVAGFTVVAASLIAFRQDNIKRRLAYSTVGHLAYIVLGVSLFSAAAWNGAMLHIVTHAMMKITLFFCAGAIYVNLHKTQISELDGIGRQMPFTMAAFTLAVVGLVGLPPVGGVLSKWYLVEGTVDSGMFVYTGVLLLSGILNAGYFFPIIIRAFFRKPVEPVAYSEASPWMVVPLTLTAVFSLLLGLFPNFIFNFAELSYRAAAGVFGGGA